MRTTRARIEALPCLQMQLGKFKVAREVLKDWSLMTLVTREMVVVDVEHDWAGDCATLTAYGPQFRALGDGEAVPHYTCRMTEDRNLGTLELRWTEVNETGLWLVPTALKGTI